ncbi:MAG TPA: UbiA family prenyltransferase [Puia sp.]|nr:UbiA family prenyltransferase [Puia sp.]
MLRKIFDFFIFSSLYIALCAVLMVWQTSELLLGSPPSERLMGFVFFSTICSYNFHWYLTPYSVNPSRRASWTQRHKILHFILYLVGLVGSGVYFFYLLSHVVALCFGAFVTFLYSAPKLPQPIFRRLRDIAVGKTIFLAFVWMYVTTVLPLVVAEATWNGGSVLFVLSRFFLIYAICIIFDYRDREDDRKDGIRSLITLLNEKSIDWLFIASLAVFALSTLGLGFFHYPGFYILLLLIPGILTAWLYNRAKRDFSDYIYYVVLDGLMMFSGLLMLIFRI